MNTVTSTKTANVKSKIQRIWVEVN